jgi:hypothetical protein
MGLVIYISSAWDQLYTGAIVNPTRCLGPAVVMRLATGTTLVLPDGATAKNYQWVYWAAAVLASLMHAFVYRLVPPGHMARRELAVRKLTPTNKTIHEPPYAQENDASV